MLSGPRQTPLESKEMGLTEDSETAVYILNLTGIGVQDVEVRGCSQQKLLSRATQCGRSTFRKH